MAAGKKEVGLRAIAGILGTGGKPENTYADFEKLILRVFGEREILAAKEKIRQGLLTVTKELLSLEEWMDTSVVRRREITLGKNQL